MNNIYHSLLVILSSLTLLGSPIALAASGDVIATYDNTKVTEKELMDAFDDVLQNQPTLKDKEFKDLPKDIAQILVQRYINTLLLEKQASAANIESNVDYQNKLDKLKKELMVHHFVEGYFKESVTEQSINEEYKKYVQEIQGKDEIKVAHILCDSEQKAKEVKRQLNEGAKFADLAKKFSRDTETKDKGGVIPVYLQPGTSSIFSDCENQIFALKKNDTSKTIKTSFGYQIFKILDKRKIVVPTFEKAKANLVIKLQQEALGKLLSELNQKAGVKLIYQNAGD